MRTKGFVQTLLFAEIKTHKTHLLMKTQYRETDVYQVSGDINGAISQVQKTAHKALRGIQEIHRSYAPTGSFQFDISTLRPRKIVIAGQLNELTDGGQVNLEKLTSFELYRRDHHEVDILTFDELYERARYIVEKQEQ